MPEGILVSLGAGEGGDVVAGDESARVLMWHVARFMEGARGKGEDRCGFVGCGGVCVGGVDSALFRLDRVFERCHAPPVPSEDVLLQPRGLKLTLYPHQRASLQRMLEREEEGKYKIASPLYRLLPRLEGGGRFYFSIKDGAVGRDAPEGVDDCRSGWCCDEPGLGKTVTSIALILSTLGQQAGLPPGSNVQIFEDDGGVERNSEEDDGEEDGNGEASSGVKRGGKRRRADFVKKFYLLSAPNRFQIFGADELGHQDGRDMRRSVQVPVRFSANKGKSALPIAPALGIRIYLSGTTLVIVPDALVDQWARQLEMHTERSALRVKIISSQKYVPSASELAFDYDVVVVDFKVISSVLSEARAGSQPSFLRVRFLRVVMDEGHKLGSTSKQVSNFARVSEMLRAERRWILTGTPAARAFDGDLSTLVPLLKFIRDGAFGVKGGEDAWKIAVQKPYYAKHPEALAVLGELLNRVMIRSLKKNVVGIPGCTIRNVFLDFTINGAKSYNALVSTVKRNLVLCVSNSKKNATLFTFLSRLARMSLLTLLFVDDLVVC